MDMHDLRHNRSNEQAELWLARLHADDCTTQQRDAFERWRAMSDANAEAYEHAYAIHQRALSLRGDPLLQAATRNARIRTAQAKAKRAFWHRGWSVAAAASVLAFVAGLGWYKWNPAEPAQHFATNVGEKRSIQLEDGSIVLLDTASAITVQYRRKQRDVELQQGQAQFTVVSQKSRPFTVFAAGGSVRAVGTRFQVRADAGAAQVLLLEGKVEVRGPPQGKGAAAVAMLAAGEQVRYGDGMWLRSRADMEVAQGWTQGELVFRARPLGEVIAEMNRYSTVKLRLGDATLEDVSVSGVFYDNNQQSLVRALELGWGLRAQPRVNDEIVLLRRK
jgi:transmembrane sensor